MIIKSKRVPTRGGALKRLLDHLLRGDENEEIRLLRGTPDDLKDAVADARRLGSQYALRHFIIAPSHEVTDDLLLSSVAMVGSEYKFDPNRTFAVRHLKDRTVVSMFDGQPRWSGLDFPSLGSFWTQDRPSKPLPMLAIPSGSGWTRLPGQWLC